MENFRIVVTEKDGVTTATVVYDDVEKTTKKSK